MLISFLFCVLALSGDIKEEEKDELDKVASKLMEIADEIPFSSSDIEPDSEEGAFHWGYQPFNTGVLSYSSLKPITFSLMAC